MPVREPKETNTKKTISYRELELHCCYTCMYSSYETDNLYCERYEINSVSPIAVCKFYASFMKKRSTSAKEKHCTCLNCFMDKIKRLEKKNA